MRRGALVSVCSRSSTKLEAAVATLQELAATVDGEGGRTRVFGKPADVTVASEVGIAAVGTSAPQYGMLHR